MSIAKIIVHSDVLKAHLDGGKAPSVLRIAAQRFFCYTTVFQAIELFAMARSAEDMQAIEDSMAAIKVLGLNPKNAAAYGKLLASHKRRSAMNLLVAGMCLESRLPLLTDQRKDFQGIQNLVIVPTRLVSRFSSGDEILQEAQRS